MWNRLTDGWHLDSAGEQVVGLHESNECKSWMMLRKAKLTTTKPAWIDLRRYSPKLIIYVPIITETYRN